MADLIDSGLTWLASQLTKHASREVTYRRGADEAVVSATIGKTIGEQEADDGLILKVEVRDYLIDTLALVFAGQQTLPKRGDQIVETENGQVLTYEVLPIGSEPPWRYSDPFRRKLRIHTRLISIDPE